DEAETSRPGEHRDHERRSHDRHYLLGALLALLRRLHVTRDLGAARRTSSARLPYETRAAARAVDLQTQRHRANLSHPDRSNDPRLVSRVARLVAARLPQLVVARAQAHHLAPMGTAADALLPRAQPPAKVIGIDV